MTKHPPSSPIIPTTPNRPTLPLPLLLIGLAALVVLVIVAIVVSSNNSSNSDTTTDNTAFTPKVTGAPSAEFDQLIIDHGDLSYDTPVESIFTVRNVGDQPLMIFGEPRVELVQGC